MSLQYTSSIDWRYLVPLAEARKILIISDGSSDLEHAFERLGVSVVVVSAQQLIDSSESKSSSVADGSFDMIAIPLGIIVDGPDAQTTYLAVHRLIRQLLSPQGVLLLGFSNRWSILRKNLLTDVRLSTWGANRLMKRFGYQAVQFYVAGPDPVSPEYIFPLTGQLIGFFLQHRYRSRLPKYLLQFLRPPFTTVLKDFLPYYYAVAKVSE